MTHKKIGTIFISLLSLMIATCTPALAHSLTAQDPTSRGVLMFSPQSHDFGYIIDASVLTTTFEIWSGPGCCTLYYNLSENYTFLDVYPRSGISDGEHNNITVTLNTTGLPVGYYNAPIQITSNSGDDNFLVTFIIVLYPEPTLVCDHQSIDFGYVPNGANSSMFIGLQDVGAGPVTYYLRESCPWLTLHPDHGTTSGEIDYINITIWTTGLPPQDYQTQIYILSNGGNLTLPVTFSLSPLRIVNVTARNGLITACITNMANYSVNYSNWSILVQGGFLHLVNLSSTGMVGPFGPYENIPIETSKKILGFGKITITISAELSKTIKMDGRIFFKTIKIFS